MRFLLTNSKKYRIITKKQGDCKIKHITNFRVIAFLFAFAVIMATFNIAIPANKQANALLAELDATQPTIYYFSDTTDHAIDENDIVLSFFG